MNRWKRFFAALLAFCLTASLLAAPSLAAGQDQNAQVTIGTGLADPPAVEVEVSWNDAWFFADAAAYQHKLAVASMALSAAAYAEAEGGPGSAAALRALGFENIISYNYLSAVASGADLAAYTFGIKEVKGNREETAQLVAVIIRGTGEIMEWAGNLNIGSGPEHEGFSKAREELLANLDSYLAAAAGSGELERKFLITGHSRGGAVANLVSASLLRREDRPEVFGYTFAAPAVCAGAAADDCGSIFNIISGEDLVPQLPLASWGYRRYGVDLLLPSRSSCGDAYDGIFGEMNGHYAQLTGRSYARYQDEAAVEKMTGAIRRLLPAPSGVSAAMLAALLSGDLKELANLAGQNRLAALVMGSRALALSSELTPLLDLERDGMTSAHCMAGYYSWLLCCGAVRETENGIRLLLPAQEQAK